MLIKKCRLCRTCTHMNKHAQKIFTANSNILLCYLNFSFTVSASDLTAADEIKRGAF